MDKLVERMTRDLPPTLKLTLAEAIVIAYVLGFLTALAATVLTWNG